MKPWLHGLGAAIISGAANAVTAMYIEPNVFNMSGDGLVALLKLAGAGAIISTFLYLKQSPLPKE